MSHPLEPRLREALVHLAEDAHAQEVYLRRIKTWPSLDELALDLDDVAEASEVWMPPELAERIRALSRLLDAMSGQPNKELWEPAALGGREWTRVRVLAASALDAFRRL